MSEEIKEEKKIDYKEFSRLLLFAGVIPASEYAASCTDTELDDIAVKGISVLGNLFLSKEEEE